MGKNLNFDGRGFFRQSILCTKFTNIIRSSRNLVALCTWWFPIIHNFFGRFILQTTKKLVFLNGGRWGSGCSAPTLGKLQFLKISDRYQKMVLGRQTRQTEFPFDIHRYIYYLKNKDVKEISCSDILGGITNNLNLGLL